MFLFNISDQYYKSHRLLFSRTLIENLDPLNKLQLNLGVVFANTSWSH